MLIDAPFADAGDLAARWRTLTTAEETQAATLLGDASNLILTEYPAACVVDDDDTEAQAVREAMLKRIACAMVKRVMMAPSDQAPMSQVQFGAGPFNQSGTFVNPTGDVYLSRAERRSLRRVNSLAATIPMFDDSDDS